MEYNIPLNKHNIDVLTRANDIARGVKEECHERFDAIASNKWYAKRWFRLFFGFQPPKYDRYDARYDANIGLTREDKELYSAASDASSAMTYIENIMMGAHYTGAVAKVYDFQLSYINAFLDDGDKLIWD